MSDTVIHATDADFDSQVLQSSEPVLVDFWAQWCGPCKMIAPSLDELAQTYAGRAKVVKVDIDQNDRRRAGFRCGPRRAQGPQRERNGRRACRDAGAVLVSPYRHGFLCRTLPQIPFPSSPPRYAGARLSEEFALVRQHPRLRRYCREARTQAARRQSSAGRCRRGQRCASAGGGSQRPAAAVGRDRPATRRRGSPRPGSAARRPR